MTFKTKIIIPSRGGLSRQKTIESIPVELHKHILVVTSEAAILPPEVSQLVVGNISISKKRQLIHQMQIDFGEDYFMVDDDVVFWAYDEKRKLQKATLSSFERFESICVENREKYGLISSHPRAFAHVPEAFSNGVSKLVYHNVEKTRNARYDKGEQFEDIEFYLQLIEQKVICVKHNSLIVVNDFSEHDDSYESRGEIIQRWSREYPNAITVTDGSSEIAGRKKVPYTIKINWSYAKKPKTVMIELENA